MLAKGRPRCSRAGRRARCAEHDKAVRQRRQRDAAASGADSSAWHWLRGEAAVRVDAQRRSVEQQRIGCEVTSRRLEEELDSRRAGEPAPKRQRDGALAQVDVGERDGAGRCRRSGAPCVHRESGVDRGRVRQGRGEKGRANELTPEDRGEPVRMRRRQAVARRVLPTGRARESVVRDAAREGPGGAGGRRKGGSVIATRKLALWGGKHTHQPARSWRVTRDTRFAPASPSEWMNQNPDTKRFDRPSHPPPACVAISSR